MKKFRTFLWMALAAVCLIFVFPQNINAGTGAWASASASKGAEKNTETDKKVKDKSFNKKKNITIKESETFQEAGFIWIAYKAKTDGYLTIKISNAGTTPAKGYFALYDNKKTVALSSKSIAYNGKNSKSDYFTRSVFGMKKGNTYYIRVKALTPVTFKSSFTKVKDKSGALLSKALNVKKNTKKTGLIPAGNFTPDYYKIKLNKKQKITLFYNIQTKGCFRLSIYSGNRCKKTKILYSSGAQKMVIYLKTTDSKGKIKKSSLKKGTYYIKLEPANSISSGYYTLKWK